MGYARNFEIWYGNKRCENKNRHTSKMAVGIEILSSLSKIISVSFNAKKISFRFLF